MSNMAPPTAELLEAVKEAEKVLILGAPTSLAALLASKPTTPESDQFVAEGAMLGEIVDRAAVTQKEGSFSARHPALGRMKTCKVCGIRERETEHQCRAQIKHPVSINRKQKIQINSVAVKAGK